MRISASLTEQLYGVYHAFKVHLKSFDIKPSIFIYGWLTDKLDELDADEKKYQDNLLKIAKQAQESAFFKIDELRTLGGRMSTMGQTVGGTPSRTRLSTIGLKRKTTSVGARNPISQQYDTFDFQLFGSGVSSSTGSESLMDSMTSKDEQFEALKKVQKYKKDGY